MRLLPILTLFLSLLIVACGEKKADPQTEARNTIEALEQKLMADPATMSGDDRLNDSLASNVVKAYLRYVETYPKDSIAPDYLFKAADVMRGQFRWENAIQVLEQLVNQYPTDPRVPNALFFAGFMLHNDLGQHSKATPYLERLIREYPEHRLAQDAVVLLETMHMSEEELIRHLEAKNDSLS
jgi:TolA-binding protein